MLIDIYLPQYHFKEFHFTTLNISSNDVYQKMLRCDLSKSFLIKLLFRLRGMSKELCTIEDLQRMDFLKLAENPGKEILFGMITENAMFNSCQQIRSGSEFINHSNPKTIKAVINFAVESKGNARHIISTETRVWCGSTKMKRRFRVYWFFIKPFSQLIRKLMLRQIKKALQAAI